MSTTPLPPPGWHPDPWDPAGTWRYWNGTAWSGHVAPRQRPDASPDVERAARAAAWARWAVVGSAVGALAVSFAIPAVVHWFRDTIDRINAIDRGEATTFSTPPSIYLLQLAGLAQTAILVPFQIWQYRANVAARALGLRLTRSPAWGVGGWFIPVINLWFPYEAVRDNLPAGHPERRIVLRWWLGWLANGLVGAIAGLVWLVQPGVGVTLWIAFAVYLGWWATTTRRMIALVTTTHQELAAARPAT